MTATPGAFNPYDPIPSPPRKRGRAVLVIVLSVVLVVLLAGGTAVFLILRQQADLREQDEATRQVVADYHTAIATWRNAYDDIEAPDSGSVLDVLYKARYSTEQQRSKVTAGCKEYRAYAEQIAALPDPPKLASVEEEAAARVPEYGEAKQAASANEKQIATLRKDTAAAQESFEKYCSFFAKEAKALKAIDVGKKAWDDALWPDGHQQVVGNYRYECHNKNGCLPLESEWGQLAAVYHKGLVEPNADLLALYRDSCPYEDLDKACDAFVTVLTKVNKSSEAFETALKNRDSAAVEKANSYTPQMATKELNSLVAKTSDMPGIGAASDPTAVLFYEAVSDNLAQFTDARLPKDSSSIGS